MTAKDDAALAVPAFFSIPTLTHVQCLQRDLMMALMPRSSHFLQTDEIIFFRLHETFVRITKRM